jgi:DNA-3-methyladenine glycosylase I
MRCSWTGDDPLMIKYHDKEWGKELHDDQLLFEFLILEGAQAGLSWKTVLHKRENYRKAFNNFDPNIVSNYDNKISELLNNEGIIRNKLKINSAINNAKIFLEIQKEFGSFDNYIWSFSKPIKNNFRELKDLPASTELSDKISKDLKKRGMNFVGSTIIYAFIQAIGMVNDHLQDCEYK